MLLSICMMVKNEEKNLERCLKSLQSIRDAVSSELIIVDTGSDDNTVEIAKQFTEKVYFHPWENDFSAIRNISLRYGTGEWFFVIDADEKLENEQQLIQFLKSPQRNQYGVVAITTKNVTDMDNPHSYSSMIGFRLFKNDGYFHFEGAIHNQARFKGETLAMPEVYLMHYGYISTDKELMERKFIRTGTILKQELEKDPTNIYYWTQLSVTYAMHKDYADAIECVEKAYTLLPEKKTPNFMFVLLHMILVYQHENMFEKVAEVCREAISIKEGYLDVYYYYAESQAVLKNYQEAFIYYEKYLDLLTKRQQLEERDVTIIEYSVSCEQVAYSNLLRLYKQEVNDYEKALYYAKKITDPHFIKSNLVNTIYLYIVLEKYSELRNYYDQWVAVIDQSIFFDLLVKTLGEFSKTAELAIAQEFYTVNHTYGLMCKLILEDHAGNISEQTQTAIYELSLDNLPIYCSDILFYLLKWHCSFGKLTVNFKEIWLTCAFEFISKRHDELSEIIYNYLHKYRANHNIHEYKLGKALARFALLLNKLNENQYREIFIRYITDGISYIQMVYNQQTLDETLIYDVKNDEEVFLLYIYKAKMNKTTNKQEYLSFLRKALNVWPAMNKGIEMFIVDFQAEHDDKKKEFEAYKIQIKSQIKYLLEINQLNEAKQIILEYKSIVPSDLEVLLLESQLFLKNNHNTLLLN
jgi:glycosyltransferase involved in cell wall biosynthesis